MARAFVDLPLLSFVDLPLLCQKGEYDVAVNHERHIDSGALLADRRRGQREDEQTDTEARRERLDAPGCRRA